MAKQAPSRNYPYIVVTAVVWTFMLGAAVMSFSHIVEVSHRLGLGWEAWTVPAFIDGIAIVGKVSMLDRFDEASHRSGRRLVLFGGVLSLAANVSAGENWGQRAFGALLVVGFVVLEHHAMKMRPARRVRKLDPAVAAARAAKAAATRARKAAEATAAPQPAPVHVVTTPRPRAPRKVATPPRFPVLQPAMAA